MASKIVVLALVLSICKVNSQSFGGTSDSQISSASKIQFIPSNNNNGVKALPQLQIASGQNFNLQAIPLSQLLGLAQSQGSKQQYEQSDQLKFSASKQNVQPQQQITTSASQQYNASGQNYNLQAMPLSQLLALAQSQGSNQQYDQSDQLKFSASKPNVQPQQQQQITTSTPQQNNIPSSSVQYTQPQTNSNPTAIPAPACSSITIPPTACTTMIDYSLANSLANALQMMIANDFINSAISNNIVNQDCISIPVVETSVPAFDLSSFVNSLNSKHLQQYQRSGQGAAQTDDGSVYNWEELLDRLQDGQRSQTQSKNSDWTAVLNYLNSKNKDLEDDFCLFLDPSKQRGNAQENSYQCSSNQGCNDRELIEAIKLYLGSCSGSCYGNSRGNIPEVVFPEEIPAQLVCNYGYMPTTVPVVTFNVQPIDDCNSNFFAGCQSC